MKKETKKGIIIISIIIVISLICGIVGGIIGTNINHDKVEVNYSDTKSPSNKNNSSDNLTVKQVAEKALPSVVEIEALISTGDTDFFGNRQEAVGSGSGVIISKNGYILTNNHVVEGAKKIDVVTSDGQKYDANLVGTDPNSDIAVLKVNADNLVPATIGNSSKLAIGDTAIVIGNPLGTLGGSVTSGIISSTSREMIVNNQYMNLIQTNAEINSGNSGGGLFDGNGNLVGIVNAKDSGTTSSGATIEGIGFAIPINNAMDVAKQLIENGKVINRATLGVALQEVNIDTPYYKQGLYIVEVDPSSGAGKAGIKKYDRIDAINGHKISNYLDLSKELRKYKVGDQVKLKITRGNETKTISVTLGNSGN